jgi:hypothetical protein
LDEDSAFITPQIVQENDMLLSSGLWGWDLSFMCRRPMESRKEKARYGHENSVPFNWQT